MKNFLPICFVLAILSFVSHAILLAAAPLVPIRFNQPNRIEFESQTARFLRFDITATNAGTPAIDELEVYGANDPTKNLARLPSVRPSASSSISGYVIHRVEHLIDGRYGNGASWVAGEAVPQSVQLEWPEPVEIDAVIFSRDREGRYADRVPLSVEIFLSENGADWTSVARIHGTDRSDTEGLAPYNSDGFVNAPQGRPRDRGLLPPTAGSQPQNEYEAKLDDAFLAEEFALLKTAGFADVERGLLQRHYPEYVEPKSQPENILPLPSFPSNEAPDFPADADAPPRTVSDGSHVSPNDFWSRTSAGSVTVFAPGNFASGPAVSQRAEVAICGDQLFVRISGNRFLNEHLAMISTEHRPTRGFLVEQNGEMFWEIVDPNSENRLGERIPLAGDADTEQMIFSAAIPLSFFPEYESRGIYVSLGIGGRHTLPGGHPVHFRPADFSLRWTQRFDADGRFVLRAESFGTKTITLGDRRLEPLSVAEWPLEWPTFGRVGPEAVYETTDDAQNRWRLGLFSYDPSYPPLCRLADMIARLETNDPDGAALRDFKKQVITPGSINPRYADPQKIVAGLNVPSEKESLDTFLASVKATGGASNDPLCEQTKKSLFPLLAEYESQQKLRAAGKPVGIAERELFRTIRVLLRELFLSSEELESVEHLLVNKRHPFHPSHNYSDLFDSTWRPGGAVARVDIPRKNGRLAPENATVQEIIPAENGVIRNPSASFDATKIYYAHRIDEPDYFRIFEWDLATGTKRQISDDGPFHDFWPMELPDGGLAFLSTRCKKKFICWRPQAFVLHRMNKEGGDLEPLSFANLTEFAPSVMNDGRILWTRSEYVDKGADYGHTLWTIRIDGTMPELVFGNTINLPQGYANGREVPETREVCCTLISHFGDLNGPIALLDLTRGPHDPAAIQSITPEVPWPGFWAKSETFREPFPVSRDHFLVAHAALDRFGVYLLDRFGNRELLYIDDAIDTICPQPFGPRLVPPTLLGGINPQLAAQGLGQFSMANVYRGLEGEVAPGAAKYLRICEEVPTWLRQLPDGTYQADHEPFMEWYASPVDILAGPFGWPSYVAKGVIGTVEIEADGSVDFVAPAQKVLFFQLLDENKTEIQRMRSVVQLQPGESRSCIGCHESRLSTPPGGRTLAAEHPGRRPVPPPWGAGPFWYERVVQPVLDKHCVACHTAETAAESPRQFDLAGTRDEQNIPASYRSLVQSGDVHYFDYTWGAGLTTKAAPYSFGTAQSRLWEILADPDHHDVKLSPDEIEAIKCWTDLNVPLWGDYQFRRER